MSAKSILSLQRSPSRRGRISVEEDDRPATPAEVEFVRARARQAARAYFEAELRATAATPDEERSCE